MFAYTRKILLTYIIRVFRTYIRKTLRISLVVAIAALATLITFSTNADDELEFFDFFNTEYVISENVNLRTGPGIGSPVIQTFPAGTVVDLFAFDPQSWSYVRVNGIMGYMHSQFIVPEWEFEEIQLVRNSMFQYPQRNTEIGTVHLTPWSEARGVWPVGTVAQVIDVRTGLVYNVRNMSNGNHADVEPLTLADTEIMRRTYGGVWSWSTRPIIVTVNGRSMAASINGMPHGGATISGNNFAGHVCIHFHGSRTHNGNRRHEQDHQNSVMEAFNVYDLTPTAARYTILHFDS